MINSTVNFALGKITEIKRRDGKNFNDVLALEGGRGIVLARNVSVPLLVRELAAKAANMQTCGRVAEWFKAPDSKSDL